MTKLCYYLDLILAYLFLILKIVMSMKLKLPVDHVLMVMNLLMINNVSKYQEVNSVYKNMKTIVLNV